MGYDYDQLKQEDSPGEDPESTVRKAFKILSRYCMLLLLALNAVMLLVVFTVRTVSYCPGDSPQGIAYYMSRVPQDLHIATFNPLKIPNNYTSSVSALGSALANRWIDLGAYYSTILIPVKHGPEFGLDPKKHLIQYPEENTPNPVPYAGYPADVQWAHQLHCLNLIRQALWHNIEFYRDQVHSASFRNSTEFIREYHVAHCVDHLRQMIMCHADLGVTGYLHASREGGHTRPDFAVHKRCRNFEAVKAWTKDHQWTAVDINIDDDHEQRDQGIDGLSPEERWSGY